jgi:hypothetical protein
MPREDAICSHLVPTLACRRSACVAHSSGAISPNVEPALRLAHHTVHVAIEFGLVQLGNRGGAITHVDRGGLKVCGVA